MNWEREETPAWMLFVHLSFLISLGLTGCGIYLLPVDWWIKGYLAMGLFFTVGSTITLSKTLRDRQESKRLAVGPNDARRHDYTLK